MRHPELGCVILSLSKERAGRTVAIDVLSLSGDERARKQDDVVGEEPLELRIAVGGTTRSLAITMRTPGNDFELGAGFLYDEAVVRTRDDVVGLTYCVDPAVDPEQRYNILTAQLRDGLREPGVDRLERHFTMNSACGVCGRAQLESLRDLGVAPVRDDVRVPASLLYQLPAKMRSSQRVFAATGGLHAAALFDQRGEAIALREDVGRHNALDKVVGWGLLNARLPFAHTVLVVSGRAGYEILQKSVMARIPIVCSVSAPSSLAVELARAFGITLVGFLRDDRANVYSLPERIA